MIRVRVRVRVKNRVMVPYQRCSLFEMVMEDHSISNLDDGR
jgi:hypothetical protein